MPEIPTAAHVLQALAPLWPPLYTALEWATQQTRVYFDAERVPVDRHLAPSLGAGKELCKILAQGFDLAWSRREPELFRDRRRHTIKAQVVMAEAVDVLGFIG
jgi:hypothetical protein